MKEFLYLTFIALLISCGGANDNSNSENGAVDSADLINALKYQEDDPFIKTIKESEFFKVSGLADKVIETDNGTVISIPKGAFKDSHGNIVEKEVTIEITDIATFEEQFKSNINSPTGQNIMLNGGAIYFNASLDGQQLTFNDDSPIFVEPPIAQDPDLLLFEGVRDENGEMHWLNPVKPKNYLTPVDLKDLDFLPAGFAHEVRRQLPEEYVNSVTREWIDSVYYSLKIDTYFTLPDSILNYSSYIRKSSEGDLLEEQPMYCKAINPVSIKVIKGEKFNKTLIATTQFEERLQTIFESRDQRALDVYAINLEKDMSVCDSLAATLFDFGSTLNLKFDAYAKENYGNVEKLPRAIKKLGEYYSKQINAVEEEIKKDKKKYQKALDKKTEEAEETIAEYKELLTKRLHYRMTRHSFKLTKNGWVAPGYIPIEPMTLSLTVKHGNQYDRVHVYTIDPSINSIFSWRSTDKINFDYAFSEDNILVYKKGLNTEAIVVAYKGDKIYYDRQDFVATNEIELDFRLSGISQSGLNKMISDIDRSSREFNKIEVDLEYQTFIYDENQRQIKLRKRQRFIRHMLYFVYKCEMPTTEIEEIAY